MQYPSARHLFDSTAGSIAWRDAPRCFTSRSTNRQYDWEVNRLPHSEVGRIVRLRLERTRTCPTARFRRAIGMGLSRNSVEDRRFGRAETFTRICPIARVSYIHVGAPRACADDLYQRHLTNWLRERRFAGIPPTRTCADETRFYELLVPTVSHGLITHPFSNRNNS